MQWLKDWFLWFLLKFFHFFFLFILIPSFSLLEWLGVVFFPRCHLLLINGGTSHRKISGKIIVSPRLDVFYNTWQSFQLMFLLEQFALIYDHFFVLFCGCGCRANERMKNKNRIYKKTNRMSFFILMMRDMCVCMCVTLHLYYVHRVIYEIWETGNSVRWIDHHFVSVFFFLFQLFESKALFIKLFH